MEGFISRLPTLNALSSLAETIRSDKDLDEKLLPGLATLLDREVDPNVDVDDTNFTLKLLQVFRDSRDQTFEGELDRFTKTERKLFDQAVSGHKSIIDAAEQYQPEPSLSARKALRLGPQVQIPSDDVPQVGLLPSQIPHHFMTNFHYFGHRNDLPSLYNDAERRDQIKTYAGLNYANWGRTIQNTPVYTFVPQTSYGVAQIVKYAKQNDMGVRVSGFRHSWSPIFGRSNQPRGKTNGDVLISTLEVNNAAKLPNLTSLPGDKFEPDATKLNSVTLLDKVLPGGKRLVRVGTSTTNEQFRRWCKEKGRVTLPMNIIEVEITMGGNNAPICHGAGIRNKTLSDQVRGIEYVDANGEQRDIADPELLRTASGCFGLIGVVTHLLLEVDPISTAVMRPKKLAVVDAIPPPPGFDVPEPLRPKDGWPRSPEQVEKSQKEFERLANEDYYSEWFWFPFMDEVYVNAWNTDPDSSNVVDYPSNVKAIIQVLGTIAVNVLQNITLAAMKNLKAIRDDEPPIRTLVPDALHFQRGVQNVRVRDLEVEMPLTPKHDGSRNYLPVQQAWWEAIAECYAHQDTCPQRMPLEMRIMGDSDVIMAPQRGHKLGVPSIEILTLHAQANIWHEYAQKVLDHWSQLRDAEGQLIEIRPHWAKEWKNYTVNGEDWLTKLKRDSYAGQIKEFRSGLTKIGEKDGWSVEEMRKRFSNEVLDELFFSDLQ